jgi:hypothetical protein
MLVFKKLRIPRRETSDLRIVWCIFLDMLLPGQQQSRLYIYIYVHYISFIYRI